MTDHIEFLYDTVVKLRPELKSRRVMVDKEKKLSEFSTADLVAELCSREGVVEYDFSSGEFYSLKSGNYREKLLGLLEMKDGPVKIIVVRSDE